ncbi:hypothetical protein [Roseiarcus sp.]|uniref:hypothetical protein n=1 Tax=Roseiarcus sp. TaxID=1969460 RepID=UPI003F9A72EF
MAVLVFILSLVLLAAGAASGYMSLDLVPTAPGLLYAFAGAVGVVGAIVVFALGVLIVRVGRLTRALREQAAAAAIAAAPPVPVEEPAALPPHFEDAEPEAAEIETEPAQELEPEAELEATAEKPSTEAQGETEDAEGAADETVNENRAGRLPTLDEIERAIETPEAPPTLIGRYTSGGANYMIFSDGTIEAETDEGAFKFASMGDFKKFLLDRNASKK